LRSLQRIPRARNDGFLAKTTPRGLPYVLRVAILRSKGYILGSKKVKSFTGLASDDFAIKALLYRNRFYQIPDLTKL
jgi:hypothetical protein